MDNFTIANTDTVHLDYSSQWFHGNWTDFSTQPPTNVSLLSSDDVHAQLVLRFPSPATGFYYYGMKRSGGGSYQICIDCDPSQPAGPFYTVDALNRTDDGHNPPVVLYSNLTLSNDFHTIVLRNTNDTRLRPQGASQITLQQFVITSPKGQIFQITSGAERFEQLRLVSSPTVTVTTSSAGATFTAAAAPGQTSSGTSARSSTNPGIIAGSIVGALLMLALLLGVGFWVLRKRQTNISATVEEAQAMSERAGLEPFVVHPSQPLRAKLSRKFDRLEPSLAPDLDIAAGNQRVFTPASSSSMGLGSSVTVPSSGSQSTLPASLPYRPPRTALDAGPVPPSEDEDTLPPDYAQIFVSRAAGPQFNPVTDVSSHRTPEPAPSTPLDFK